VSVSINEVSSAGVSSSTDTEPDFGNFLSAGKVRKLGVERAGYADAWFTSGGYEQTQFPQADDIWGGNFDDLTSFNLDPGIYRRSAQEKLKIPPTWQQYASAKDVDPLEMPNTISVNGDDGTSQEFDVEDVDVPKYRDFF
tara:strand:+ start:5465 stop:5884 length:420 start_codon:yes stop_codon:yes gene_type:complete